MAVKYGNRRHSNRKSTPTRSKVKKKPISNVIQENLEQQSSGKYVSKYLAPGKSAGLGFGMAAFGFGIDLYSNLKNGDNFAAASGKALATGAAFAVAPGIMTTAMLTVPLMTAAGEAIPAAGQMLAQKYNNSITPGTNFVYRDSQAALTMRQAAVQAIQGSKLNARNALGGEAALMHRGYQR